MKELQKKMINNAMSYNKHLSKEKLKEKSFSQLLALCHPTDRNDYVKERKSYDS